MLSVDKFLALVERSKLVDSDRLAHIVADWKLHATIRQLDDPQHCADHLANSGLMTHWQCKKLLEGRHRGFYLGRYKLLDHLGTGGMSSVYLAEHVLMQRRVAIKVLPQNRVSDAAYLARFHLEAQAAAALDHRNIVRAYDLDNEGKIHYLVMEYVEGRDLYAVVCQDGPLDYHTAAHCIAQAAAGLDHAHHCGLVHRDIKPANLLVDLKGTVKILDMGLAKFTPVDRPVEGPTHEEHVLGTADYLAPEQAVNSQAVDHRADIYSLGCTLYFLLTGHPPFAEGTSLERMAAHQQRLPPSIMLDRPDAPPALVAICRRMMEKSPLNRYQSASEVELALADWLESEVAAGHVDPTALSAAARLAVGSSVWRRAGGSSANLVSGSTSDLHRPPDAPPLSSALHDTDLNLQRATAKMPPPLGRSWSEAAVQPSAGSEVLSPPIAPPRLPEGLTSGASIGPPPIEPPPGPDAAAWSAISQSSQLSQNPRDALPTNPEIPPADNPPLVAIHRAARRSDGLSWWWVLVLFGLAVAAALMALVTLGS